METRLLNVLKLGHVEFEVHDLARMTDYYQDTIDLTLTDQYADTAYLSTVVDHHSMVLRQGSNGTRLTKMAFQVAPAEADELVNHLRVHGAPTEIREGSQPSIRWSGQSIPTNWPSSCIRSLSHRPIPTVSGG